MFQHILIAYDGSTHAKKALAYGIQLARHHGTELTVATVFAKVPDILGSPQYEEMITRITARAQATADTAAEEARAAGIDRVRVEVLEGSAAECILNVAETRGCDCIVVGSRGFNALTGLLLGSVSDRIAQHAKVPVLIAK